MLSLNFLIYSLLILFGLYFNEIIILNEKFLLLIIFLGFCIFIKNFVEDLIKEYFLNIRKELFYEIFFIEYCNDIKFSDNYLYLSIDLFRQKIFKKIFNIYFKGLNFLIIFYYNLNIKRDILNIISLFETLINDIYYFIIKKHLYIKLNFLYRFYYYIFYKFRIE